MCLDVQSLALPIVGVLMAHSARECVHGLPRRGSNAPPSHPLRWTYALARPRSSSVTSASNAAQNAEKRLSTLSF